MDDARRHEFAQVKELIVKAVSWAPQLLDKAEEIIESYMKLNKDFMAHVVEDCSGKLGIDPNLQDVDASPEVKALLTENVKVKSMTYLNAYMKCYYFKDEFQFGMVLALEPERFHMGITQEDPENTEFKLSDLMPTIGSC